VVQISGKKERALQVVVIGLTTGVSQRLCRRRVQNTERCGRFDTGLPGDLAQGTQQAFKLISRFNAGPAGDNPIAMIALQLRLFCPLKNFFRRF